MGGGAGNLKKRMSVYTMYILPRFHFVFLLIFIISCIIQTTTHRLCVVLSQSFKTKQKIFKKKTAKRYEFSNNTAKLGSIVANFYKFLPFLFSHGCNIFVKF